MLVHTINPQKGLDSLIFLQVLLEFGSFMKASLFRGFTIFTYLHRILCWAQRFSFFYWHIPRLIHWNLICQTKSPNWIFKLFQLYLQIVHQKHQVGYVKHEKREVQRKKYPINKSLELQVNNFYWTFVVFSQTNHSNRRPHVLTQIPLPKLWYVCKNINQMSAYKLHFCKIFQNSNFNNSILTSKML